MQWNRVKTILILVLLAANLFLAVNNVLRVMSEYYLSGSFVRSASEALSESGVSAPASVIPHRRPDLPVLKVSSAANNFHGFAQLLLGGGVKQAVSGGYPEYSSSTGTFTVDSPSSFVFQAGSSAPEAGSPESFVKAFFRKSGLSGSYSTVSHVKTEAGTQIIVEETVSKTPVRGCRITFLFTGSKLSRMYGKWVFTAEAAKKSLKLADAVNVLFSIADRRSGGVRPDSSAVKSMRLVYYSPSSAAMASITVLPAYLITYDSGTSYLYDLTQGRLDLDPVTVE
jgi:hypothetical protein